MFAGQSAADRTERLFLRRLIEHLTARGIDSVILRSFHVGRKSQQIDLIVATSTAACVVEVKGYVSPVQGDLNGPWTQTLDDGSLRDLGDRNPYVQASEARFAVVDELERITSVGKDALRRGLSALVCLYPEAPLGSTIPSGDYKAHIGGFARLEELLGAPAATPIDLRIWRDLAKRCGLRPDGGPRSSESQALIDDFHARLIDLRATLNEARAPSALFVGPVTTDEDEILDALATGGQAQIVGGSGCGKSFMLDHLSLQCARRGILSLTVQAGGFEGDLAPLLRKAAAIATPAPIDKLFAAADACGVPVVLFVDGLNECSPDRRPRLIEALQAARLRVGLQLCLTSQTETVLPLSLAGTSVSMSQPDAAGVEAIVRLQLNRPLKDEERPALEIATTANDAKILGEVLAEPANVDGRYALYNAFARRRLSHSELGPHAVEALRTLAADMRSRFVSVLPAASISRLLRAPEKRADAVQIERLAFASGLLKADSGLARFRHDLLADFFAADDLLQTGAASDWIASLRRPINADLAVFVVGGCSTISEVEEVLAGLQSTAVLHACLRGRCGSKGKAYVLGRCRKLVADLGDKYTTARFGHESEAIEARRWTEFSVSFEKDLTDDDRTYLPLLAHGVRDGLLAPILSMFRRVDAHLDSEGARLSAAFPDIRLNWLGEVKGAIYGFPYRHDHRELHTVIEATKQYRVALEDSAHVTFALASEQLERRDDLCAGELFFLFELLSGFARDAGPPPKTLPQQMQRAWNQRIYHLSLLAIDMAQRFGREMEDTDRKRLGERLESWFTQNNPMLNGALFDVLSLIGCWTPNITVEEAEANFRSVLALPLTPESADEALTLYIQSFDHPDRETIAEALYDRLSDDDRHHLYVRAASAQDRNTMAMSFVLTELASRPSEEAIPALLRFAALPAVDTHSVQDSMANFVNATTALAKLDVPLAAPKDVTPSVESAWVRVGQLVYALHRPDRSDAQEAWRSLESLGAPFALDPIVRLERERNHFTIKAAFSFCETFPNGVLGLARAALLESYQPQSIFYYFRPGTELIDGHRAFALSHLGGAGDASDLASVRRWVEHPTLGSVAILAAKAIESRRSDA